MAQASTQAPSILWFEEVGIGDIPVVGGKNASLGEMYRELAGQGVKVPNGFAVTAEAYRVFLRAAKLDEKIKEMFTEHWIMALGVGSLMLVAMELWKAVRANANHSYG